MDEPCTALCTYVATACCSPGGAACNPPDVSGDGGYLKGGVTFRTVSGRLPPEDRMWRSTFTRASSALLKYPFNMNPLRTTHASVFCIPT